MCTLMLCIFFLERASFMTLPNSHTCFLAHNRLNECLYAYTGENYRLIQKPCIRLDASSTTTFYLPLQRIENISMAKILFLPLNSPSKIYRSIDESPSISSMEFSSLWMGNDPIAAFDELANS